MQKLNLIIQARFLQAVVFPIVFAVVLLTAADLLACPTCKDGIAENDPASAAQAAGYFYSILFMMAMPFLIIGTFGGAAYLSIRRAREQQAAALVVESDSAAKS